MIHRSNKNPGSAIFTIILVWGKMNQLAEWPHPRFILPLDEKPLSLLSSRSFTFSTSLRAAMVAPAPDTSRVQLIKTRVWSSNKELHQTVHAFAHAEDAPWIIEAEHIQIYSNNIRGDWWCTVPTTFTIDCHHDWHAFCGLFQHFCSFSPRDL